MATRKGAAAICLFKYEKDIMKKFIVAAVLLLAGSAYAAGTPHPAFNTPEGFEVSKVQDLEFDTFRSASTYTCYQTKKRCTSKDFGFTDEKNNNGGNSSVEGTVKIVTYKKKNGDISKLLVRKNYDAIFQGLGGKPYAYVSYDDSDTTRVYLIEKDNQKIWVELYFDSNITYTLSIITSGGYKSIITAGKFAEEIKKQGYVTLNVNFDNNKAIIKDGDKPTLNEVVTLLKNDTGLKLSVDGHTDNVGNATANKTLSQQRSESIVKYLTSNGVAANRLVAKGFGSETPVGDNRSEEGRAKNRRVELVKF